MNAVGTSTGCDLQGVEQGHTGLQQSGHAACPDGGIGGPDERTRHRQTQAGNGGSQLPSLTALVGVAQAQKGQEHNEQSQWPRLQQTFTQAKHQTSGCRQFGAKRGKDVLKHRYHPDQDHGGHQGPNQQHGHRVDQGHLHFLAQLVLAFQVGGQATQHAIEVARHFACRHQLAVEMVEDL